MKAYSTPTGKRMALHKHAILLIILLTTACKSALGQPNPNPSPAVDAVIQSEMNLERLPGASTVIVKDGRIVWIRSYGLADIANAVPVRDTTVFLLASISKLFTGTAAMQLAEAGAIGLDEDVGQHLPWALQIPAAPEAPVTPRQLMTHVASIRDNYDVMDTYYDSPDPTITLAECMQRYFSTNGVDYSADQNFLPGAPGSVYEYSNIATALNGYLVERASGTAFDQYCNEHLFAPLCMEKTSWNFAGYDPAHVAVPYRYSGGNYIPYAQYGFADYPSGQLRSNVLDMANFMIAYLNDGEFGPNSILGPASIEAMWTPQVPDLEPTQGLNWYREELFHSGGTSWLWGHNGGEQGASTDLYLDPTNKIGICVLSNGEGDAIYICDELYDYGLSLDAATGFLPGCLTTSLPEAISRPSDKVLVKVVDLTGREALLVPNTPLVKIYDDGSAERVFIME